MKRSIKKKSILIIGAGFGQFPAIIKAKELGLETIVIDKNPEAMGMKTADHAYAIDVLDDEGAIEIARKHDVSGVMTMQTDLPVPIVGTVINAINLNGVSKLIAERCSNKIETRIAFRNIGVPQPDFYIVENLEDTIKSVEEIGYPCIVKAPDSSGSRGVIKVKNKNEIEAAYKEAFKYSKKSQILVEENISGLEIGAQCFSVEGKCVKVLLHNDKMSKPPYMIPTGHSFPIRLNREEETKVIKIVADAVDALEIKSGPTNVDLILDKNNEPKIIEIGARIGATCLPECVEYFTGIDWVKQAIKAAIGEKVDLNDMKKQPVAAVILEAPKDGVFKGCEIPDIVKNNTNLKEIEVTAKIGQQVNVLRKGTDRIGKLVVIGENINEVELLVEDLKSMVKIMIK